MKKIFEDRTSRTSIICAILMLVLLVCQFLPFWNYPTLDGSDSASIQGYVWGDPTNEYLEAYIKHETGNDNYRIESIVAMPVMVILFGVIGIICCIKFNEHWKIMVIPAVVGLVGTIGYIVSPVFHLGSLWVLHMIIAIAILALALTELIPGIKSRIELKKG